MFHYLYPPISIGLGAMLVFMEGMYLKTGDPVYEHMTKFWVKVFALVFSLGVASGIVMEFEFGTNWATYSRFVGDVFGSALAAEGIFAFFLESGFLAVLVFGWNKVSPKVHFLSTIMVALGSMFSAVWIVVANSWMQTPAGFHIVGEGEMARAEITNFWELVFNPSSMCRLTHVILGAWILAAFFVMSVCAFYVLKGRHLEFARRCFTIALVFAAVSSVAQVFAGHWSAKVVAEHQPAKLAAFEGIFETRESTELWLFGLPSADEQRVKYGIAVPGMLSFLVHGDFKTPVPGLDTIPADEQPPLFLPFQTYHIMVSLGTFFIGITFLGLFLLWRGKLFNQRWLMWIFVFSVVLPHVANQAGWIAAEVGRQPWIVYGLLRTADGVSKSVSAGEIGFSLSMFLVIYTLLFVLFLYLLDRKIKHGPTEPGEPGGGEGGLVGAVTARGKGSFSMAEGKEGAV
jgi:cytochrome d ubiquinol oxidase subunit I